MYTTEKRHSSPSIWAYGLDRPRTHRKRSNSLPIVEALGCSTPEAELVMAEGRAARSRRQVSVRTRRSRRRPSPPDQVYHPHNHLKYLDADFQPSNSFPSDISTTGHSRIPSNASSTTVIGPDQPQAGETRAVGEAPGSPLEDYSATLAKFIQSQLNSIPSYQTAHTTSSPCSCPDLTRRLSTPPQSPTKSTRRPIGVHSIVEIPPIRPPLQSAFSAWSSTDDGVDEGEDDVPSLPNVATSANSTSSMLGIYDNSNASSFFFTSTPEEDPITATGFSFPNQSDLPGTASPPLSPSPALSYHAQLSSSSAPSFSSVSTASYFDCKPPITLAPHVRARIIAAVTPNHNGKTITAVSPFEGDSLTKVHDILIESQQRVLVDGLSFDMLRDFNMPDEGLMRLPTPC
ncbi:hypothetical protein K504DRAFT_372169 [Pleomassaria siparia CBS 279.74]|uniref:Uncharacterized protein n=1 Tax=Pleomassaria siparia CBS 279.74 TaxID=1314801 RepID=A0A6G1KJF2_9PLEO|nr:hypothetical protein K504DRAFT_372169 [Pleomassaria siparia CBS 279.74]